MTYIRQKFENSVLEITLNRPDKMNSLIEPMAGEFRQALKRAEEQDVRAVLLRAEGKAFCAGQDLSEVVERSSDPGYELGDTVRGTYNPVIRAIRYLEKPVICAVQGTAAGAGANLAFACDITVASLEAVFVQAFSKIGLIPDSGGTWFLPRLAGLARANALYLLDEKLPAERAVAYGLIYKAVPPEDLESTSNELCKRLAAMPTKGFGLYKKAINHGLNHTLDEQLEIEADLQSLAGKTEDYKEGVDAFLNKRKPKYNGR